MTRMLCAARGEKPSEYSHALEAALCREEQNRVQLEWRVTLAHYFFVHENHHRAFKDSQFAIYFSPPE